MTERQTKLADALVAAEARGIFDPDAGEAIVLAQNAICEELGLPLDETEQGFTSETNRRIDDFVAANRSDMPVIVAATATLPDVTVENHGTIFLLRPGSLRGERWLQEYVSEDAPTFGKATACEPRFAEAIVEAMQNDGLEVR